MLVSTIRVAMATVLLWLACLGASVTAAPVLTQPEQIHLAYGEDETQMVVTWVTQNATRHPSVQYGPSAPSYTQEAVTQQFVDDGSEKRTINVYRAIMVDLKPGQRYIYRVGSPGESSFDHNGGWSELFFFNAMKYGTQWSPRFAVYGDMGNVNAQSLPRLQDETERGHFDAILHVGDFAYDMNTDNGRFGDAFMNQIESVAAYVPYMTAVGNHESAYNFSHYINRFSMPGGSQNSMFYSFNVGPAHIISFSSEYYYYVEYGWAQIPQQYAWMEQDLREANKPENRAKRPWIITMCHRPMYCSNSNDPEHCPNAENVIRVGLPLLHAYSPEQLIYKYGVDLHLQAHEHSYERTWPVYNNTVCNGTDSDPYNNPKAPVHIVTGSGGCQERVDPFTGTPQPFSAFRSDDYGYSRMTIHNATHLYLEQVSDDKAGKVIDKMMIVKDTHGPHDCPTRGH